MRERKKVAKVWVLLMAVLCMLFASVLTAQAAAKPKLSKTKVTITGIGKTYNLSLSGNSKAVVWATSNKNVVQIKKLSNNKVRLTAKKKGTAKVTAKVGKKTYTCKVTVKEVPKISATSIKLNLGKTYTLNVTGTTSTPKWSVGNKSIVSIKKINGKSYRVTASATKPGTTYVYAKVSGKKLKCKVTVKEAPQLSKTLAIVPKGKSFDLKVSGTAATPKWSVSNKSVISIEKKSKYVYRVKAKNNGEATVNVKISGKTYKCTVYVAVQDYGGGGTPGTYEMYHFSSNNIVRGAQITTKSGNAITMTPTLWNPGEVIRGYCKNNANAQWKIISGNSVKLNTEFKKGSPGIIEVGFKDVLVLGVKAGKSEIGLYESGKLLIKLSITVTTEWPGYAEYDSWRKSVAEEMLGIDISPSGMTPEAKAYYMRRLETMVEYGHLGEYAKKKNYFSMYSCGKYDVMLSSAYGDMYGVFFLGDVAKDLGYSSVTYYNAEGKRVDADLGLGTYPMTYNIEKVVWK